MSYGLDAPWPATPLCVVCPSYGLSCEGLEREWWTEQEWDDFRERDG